MTSINPNSVTVDKNQKEQTDTPVQKQNHSNVDDHPTENLSQIGEDLAQEDEKSKAETTATEISSVSSAADLELLCTQSKDDETFQLESVSVDEQSTTEGAKTEEFRRSTDVKFLEDIEGQVPPTDGQRGSESSVKSVAIDLMPQSTLVAEDGRKFTLTSVDNECIFESWEEKHEIEDNVTKGKQGGTSDTSRKEPIDRNMYYELYKIFSERYRKEKMKNNYLQSKLVAYYSRRRMMFVLREQLFHVAEMQSKYERELDVLESVIEESEREKQMSYGEIVHLRNNRDVKLTELKELFEKLQREENEYGKGLTFEKTGRHNLDKIVERFVKRQRTQMALTIKLRSNYIKLVNNFNEKQKALEALDHLGPGFRIMDYVQLKTDNRDLHDKLEEKESELTMLRNSCQNTMQILAHNREKSAVIDLDIEKLKQELEEVNNEYEDARQNLHYIKEERNHFRKETKNVRLQYSLYINKKLLRDMEQSIGDLANLKKKMEAVKAEYQLKENQVQMIRKNIHCFLYKKIKEKNASSENGDNNFSEE